MARSPRFFSPDIAYHIIVRGNNKQPLFLKNQDYREFLHFAARLKSEIPFKIFHYCLMPNHVHLLAQFENLLAFRKVPHRLFLRYAKYFSREYDHVGHVFQGRFKSRAVENNFYLLECGRYIERNPMKAGLTLHPADYHWSSAPFYIRQRQDALVDQSPLYLNLSPEPELRK